MEWKTASRFLGTTGRSLLGESITTSGKVKNIRATRAPSNIGGNFANIISARPLSEDSGEFNRVSLCFA